MPTTPEPTPAVSSPASPWELFVLEYARSRDQPVASLVQGAYADGTIDLPFAFVLARRADQVVLVDTGFMREGSGARMAERFGIPRWVSPVRLLAALGIAPGDVGAVVLTHAHFDHMGAIDQFPRAHLYLQKKELLSWIEALALPPRFGFLTQVLNPDDIRRSLDAAVEHRLTLLDGDVDHVLPGIHVRTGVGHTLGQQYVAVDAAAGRFVVSGDCVYCARNLVGTNGDGVYVPLGSGIGSAWDQLMSFDKIQREIGGDLRRLVILHDFERWRHATLVGEVEGLGIFRVA